MPTYIHQDAGFSILQALQSRIAGIERLRCSRAGVQIGQQSGITFPNESWLLHRSNRFICILFDKNIASLAAHLKPLFEEMRVLH
jgi:hypothetical protein